VERLRRRGQAMIEFSMVLPAMIGMGIIGLLVVLIAYNNSAALPQMSRTAADEANAGIARILVDSRISGRARMMMLNTGGLTASVFNPAFTINGTRVYGTTAEQQLTACRSLLNRSTTLTVSPPGAPGSISPANTAASSPLRRLGWHWACPAGVVGGATSGWNAPSGGDTLPSTTGAYVYTCSLSTCVLSENEWRSQLSAAMGAAAKNAIARFRSGIPVFGNPRVDAVVCLMSEETMAAAFPPASPVAARDPLNPLAGCAAKAEMYAVYSSDGSSSSGSAYTAFGPAPAYVVVELRGASAYIGVGSATGVSIKTGVRAAPAFELAFGTFVARSAVALERPYPACSGSQPDCIGVPK